MNPLVIRTALPFGFLAFALLCVAAIVVGARLILSGRRAQKRPRVIAGAFLGAFGALVLVVNLVESGSLDLNPRFTSAKLVGVWRDGEATLSLMPDGTFTCMGAGECNGLGASGYWALQSAFELKLWVASPDIPVVRRVVSYHGSLTLSTPIVDDPDMWDGHLTFRQMTFGD